jgi:hypothetical protein
VKRPRERWEKTHTKIRWATTHKLCTFIIVVPAGTLGEHAAISDPPLVMGMGSTVIRCLTVVICFSYWVMGIHGFITRLYKGHGPGFIVCLRVTDGH